MVEDSWGEVSENYQLNASVNLGVKFIYVSWRWRREVSENYLGEIYNSEKLKYK